MLPLLTKQPKEGQVYNDDINDVPDNELLLQCAKGQFIHTSDDAPHAGNEATVNDNAIKDGPQPAQATTHAAKESDNDGLGAPLVAPSEVGQARIAQLASAAAAALVTQFQTWQE